MTAPVPLISSLSLAMMCFLAGCMFTPSPMSPDIALREADKEITRQLGNQKSVGDPESTPTLPIRRAGSPTVTLWYCDHPLAGPLLTSPTPARTMDAPMEVAYIGPWRYASQKLLVALATNDDLPDIVLLPRVYAAMLAGGGRLAPLDGILPASLVNDFRPAVREAGSYVGHLYTLPADGFCMLFYADPKHTATLPTDWTALRESAISTCSTLPHGVYGIGAYLYTTALASNCGAVFREGRSALGEPAALESLIYLTALCQEGFASPDLLFTPDQAFNAFQGGVCAMTCASSENLPAARRMAPPAICGAVPGKNGPISELTGWVWVVFRGHDPARNAAISQVLDYLTGPAVLGEKALEAGSAPVRESVATSIPGVAEHPVEQAFRAVPPRAMEPEWNGVEPTVYHHAGRALRWTEKTATDP